MQSGIRNSQPAKRGMGPPQGQRSSHNMTSSTPMGPQASNMPFQGPMVLTPVSQLGNVPRRNSRAMSKPEIADKSGMAFDPEHYNPDGSLRTMHRLPGFDQSYAQAMNARYVRHSRQLEREKELSVKDIFSKKN